jgi:hypothetical protein
MLQRQLKCEVTKGMFSDERAVTFMSRAGEVSVFVPKDVVHENNGSSTVNVRAYQLEKAWLAILPTEDALAVYVDENAIV